MRSLTLSAAVLLLLSHGCGDDDSTGDSGGSTTNAMTNGTSADGGSGGDTTAGVEPGTMTFFVTSQGSGAAGGNLGGLAGADEICQTLAEAAGSEGLTWHAYLSTTTENARDRIGSGPWYNFEGEMIAEDVASLHTNGLSNDDPQHVLTEYGEIVTVGDQYDILTGSQDDGTYYEDRTCNDWTDGTSEFEARVGHSHPPNDPQYSRSWNNAHSTGGCSEQDLIDDTGIGRIYCFAID